MFVASLIIARSAALTLENVEQAVKAACIEIQSRFAVPIDQVEGIDDPASCPTYNACTDVPTFPALHCNATYGKSSSCSCVALQTSFEREVTLYPTSVDPTSAAVRELNCRMVNIGQKYRQLLNQHNLISLYSGFSIGVHKSFPARDWATTPSASGCREPGPCPSFDPRVRNWYTAASSGPKNVILVMDYSGSMLGARIAIAKEAATTVINTLTFADYVQVVTFSSSSSSMSSELVQATKVNKDALIAYVVNTPVGGSTNFYSAFQSTFNILDSSTNTSGCRSAVLFLTDGRATSGIDGDDLLQYVTLRNMNHNASIFSYALGDDADRSIKSLSCAHNGIFAAIPDGGGLRTKMSQYYEYFATGLRSDRVVYAEPFEECCGMGTITTASVPCYSAGTAEVESTLIGVASSSVPTNLLGNIPIEELLSRSSVCSPFNLDEEGLENLRGSERCSGALSGGAIAGIAVGAAVVLITVLIISIVVYRNIAVSAPPPAAQGDPIANYYNAPPDPSAPPQEAL